MKDDVTVVLTSCGRYQLLCRTLDSFRNYNSYPVSRVIVIEDSGDAAMKDLIHSRYGDWVDLIFNEPRIGQIQSIDRAYALVDTPYIFHCEDDWEFYRSGFLEESMDVLSENPMIINVMLRELWDMQGWAPDIAIQRTRKGTLWRYLPLYFRKCGVDWHGFSFNPGLRRRSDYALAASYAAIGHESHIGLFFKERGFRGAILEQGACRHTGGSEHIVDPSAVAWAAERDRQLRMLRIFQFLLPGFLIWPALSFRRVIKRMIMRSADN